ncbi:MAG: 23S rRNA (pseudouridine(1915)-N(3))-methyltransferase RlmH [Bacilli bacterium]|nr:23S rRNA (pseudouridine(1915)-N(3))-methyltransferase RlmH [Bacilli bacterium]
MIRIICIGKIKEKYLIDAIEEYKKRLSKYTKLEILELPDVSYDLKKTLEVEKEEILKNIKLSDYNILLDIDGRELTSIELANSIDKIRINNSNINFIVGGSYGVHDDIKRLANDRISFSKLTFPHQLFRVILLEQIYRSFKILNNEEYHK